MYGISGYGSNSISTLFSGFGGSSKKNASASGLSALTASLSDYNMIRSGSYKKLMTAYFRKTDGDSVKSSFNNTRTNRNAATSKDSADTLGKVKSAAGELEDSASALLKSGSNSAFSKVTTKDDKGLTTMKYDTDKIYKAVKSFVNDYNDMIKAADKSKTGSIQKAAISMINGTSRYASSLKDVGISVDSEDFTLSIDEETFKNADMNKVKSLFNGAGSYASNVKSQASMIEYRAGNEASKANTYSRYGGYNSTYSSGSVWDSYY